MIRAAFLAVMLTTPVVAQEMMILEFQLGKLQEQQDNQALAPLMAACLLGNGDAEATAKLFTDAGWTREDDAEMGMTSLVPAWGDPSVTLYDNGAICDVTSESQGVAIADQNMAPLLLAAQYPIASASVPSGCMAYDLGKGVTAEITSSGNDPQCQSETTSNVRFTFPAP